MCTITVAAGVPTLASPDGSVTGIVDNGVGDFTITIREPAVENELAERVQVRGATPGLTAVEYVSPTQRRIRVVDAAGAALDPAGLSFVANRIRP